MNNRHATLLSASSAMGFDRIVLILFMTGCSSTAGGTDASDHTTISDSPALDVPTRDSGADVQPSDAGFPDQGQDAATTRDEGPLDATLDVPLDASTFDTDTPDSADSATPDVLPAVDGPLARYAFVHASAFESAITGTNSGFVAAFYEALPGCGSCLRREGPCVVLAATVTGSASFAELRMLSAGTISVASPGVPTLTTTPSPNGDYRISYGSGILWGAGAGLDVTGTGAEVPAFRAGVSFPAGLSVTAPMPDGSLRVTIDRSMDFVTMWTPAPSGSVLVEIQLRSTGRLVQLQCEYPREAGIGSVPASMLAELTWSGTAEAYFAVYAADSTRVSAGLFTVDVRALGQGLFSAVTFL